MTQGIIQRIYEGTVDTVTEPQTRRDFGGKKRPGSKARLLPGPNNSGTNGWYVPLVSTIEASVPSALVVVNNNSSSEADRRFIDRQLASIASLTSRITQKTVAGREPRVVYDEVGFPPFTFSVIQTFRRGGSVTLANSWFEEGMKTLIHEPVRPPVKDGERRAAILFGAGPDDQLETLENSFLQCFNPSHFCKSFGPDLGDGVVHFFVQWSIFPEELAEALGTRLHSAEITHLMDLLESHAKKHKSLPYKMASLAESGSVNR